jgi:hypothetical protein
MRVDTFVHRQLMIGLGDWIAYAFVTVERVRRHRVLVLDALA